MTKLNDRLESTILTNLLYDNSYCRKVIPFIKEDYFSEDSEKVIFQKILSFIEKYDSLPTKEALLISISNDRNILDTTEKTSKEVIQSLQQSVVEQQWLLDQTENWCKDRALYLALMESIKIADDKKGKVSKGSIPKILTDALAVSFDSNVGHSYLDDTDSRYEFYHKKEEKLPFDLDCMNKITNDGVPRKTLNVILAGCVHPNTTVKVRFRKRISK